MMIKGRVSKNLVNLKLLTGRLFLVLSLKLKRKKKFLFLMVGWIGPHGLLARKPVIVDGLKESYLSYEIFLVVNYYLARRKKSGKDVFLILKILKIQGMRFCHVQVYFLRNQLLTGESKPDKNYRPYRMEHEKNFGANSNFL